MDFEQRVQSAIAAYKSSLIDPSKTPSFGEIGAQLGVSDRTLRDRYYGERQPRETTDNKKQRLSSIEEESLKTWIILAAGWAWPIRTSDLRSLAQEPLAHQI